MYFKPSGRKPCLLFCCWFFLFKKNYTSDTTWSLTADFAVMLATLLFKHSVPHYCLFFFVFISPPCNSLLHQHCLFDYILRWAYHSYRPLWIVCCQNILFHAITSAFPSDPLLNRFCLFDYIQRWAYRSHCLLWAVCTPPLLKPDIQGAVLPSLVVQCSSFVVFHFLLMLIATQLHSVSTVATEVWPASEKTKRHANSEAEGRCVCV